MELQRHDRSTVAACDESKCVSRGKSDLHDGSFTCYGDDGTFYPKMCADGFLPRLVEDEPYSLSSPPEGSEVEAVPVRYFTCCPPDGETNNHNHNSLESPVRRCSDPIAAISENDSASSICDHRDDSRKVPRRMKPSVSSSTSLFGGITLIEQDSYLCCDSAPVDAYDDDSDSANGFQTNSTATDSPLSQAASSLLEDDFTDNFLSDTECVPYQNKFYQSAKVQNRIGWLSPITCDFPDGDFVVPRPLPLGGFIDDVAESGRYQCCVTGPPLPSFVDDSAFRITLYPLTALYSLAALISTTVAISLLVPLFLQMRKDRKAANDTESFPSSSAFDSRSVRNVTLPGSSRHLTPPSSYRTSFSRQSFTRPTPRRGKKRYSTYNLYLVYLAALDLYYSLFMIAWFGSYLNQDFDPNFYGPLANISLMTYNIFGPEAPITIPYLIANVWINAIICYQVLLLLKASRSARRIDQPSLRRVNLQSGSVYLFSAVLGTVLYLVMDACRKAGINGDYEKVRTLSLIPIVLLVIFFLPPIGYVIYVTILIYRRGYIPSVNGATARDKAVRELHVYFFRIIAIFLIIFLPGLVIVMCAESGQSWLFLVVQLLAVSQPILTTCVILTKSDARKYVLDLVTLTYCFGNKGSCRKGKASTVVGSEPFATIPASRSLTGSGHFGSGFVTSSGPFGSGIANCGSTSLPDDEVQSNDTELKDGKTISDGKSSDCLSDGDEEEIDPAADPEIGTKIYSSVQSPRNSPKPNRPVTILSTGEAVSVDELAANPVCLLCLSPTSAAANDFSGTTNDDNGSSRDSSSIVEKSTTESQER